MKLRQYAATQGICYATAWRWFRSGNLPHPARRLANGTILVDYVAEAPAPDRKIKTVVYARVSGHDQKDDLDRQVGRVCAWATEHNMAPTQTVREVGSGLNGRRRGLLRILSDPELKSIIVEHRDRLARWGWDFIAASLAARGVSLHVVDDAESTDDIVQDLVDVTTSVCARLYGKRSARNRARKLARNLQKTPAP